MLCEKCKENPATMHYKQIINGKVSEYHLCERCAREENITPDIHDFDIFSMLSPKREPSVKRLICPMCQTTLDSFRKTGIIGCHKCYEVFAPYIEPMLTEIHGCNEHIKGAKIEEKAASPEEQIKTLQAALEKAISTEEYEKAATIRDEIKKLREGK